MLVKYLKGEDDMGDESTRTLWTEEVLGTFSIELSNKR